MFAHKLCCVPSLYQSAGALLSIMRFCTVLGMICFCPPAWLPGVVGCAECYRVHFGSEKCCHSGTISEIMLQLHLHQPVNSFWSGQNTEN